MEDRAVAETGQPVPEDGETFELSDVGIIKPFEVDDLVLGEKVSVSLSDIYTTLRIGKRYYYFRRHNGELDGTGMDV